MAKPQPNQLDPATLRQGAAILSARNNPLGPVLATAAARIAAGDALLPAEAAQVLGGLKAAGVTPKTVAQAANTVNLGAPAASPAPGQLDPATLNMAADALEGNGLDLTNSLNSGILRGDAQKILAGQTLSAGDQQVALNLLAQVGVRPVFLGPTGQPPPPLLPGTQGGPFLPQTPMPVFVPSGTTTARNPNVPAPGAAPGAAPAAPSNVPLFAAGLGLGALGVLGWKLWRRQ